MHVIFSLIYFSEKLIPILTFSPSLDHTSPIFKSLKALTFHKVVIHRSSLLINKLMNNLLPAAMNNLLFEIMIFDKNCDYMTCDLHAN